MDAVGAGTGKSDILEEQDKSSLITVGEKLCKWHWSLPSAHISLALIKMGHWCGLSHASAI